jgi:predicted permease
MPPTLALVVILLACGYLARRFGQFPGTTADALNRFVIDLCVPAVILRVVPELRLRWELSILVLIPWLLAALALPLARLVGKLLRLDRSAEAAVFLCTALGNTSFLGFPLIRALLGDAALPLAAVYDQLGSFLLLCIVVPISIARASGSGTPDALTLAKRVVRFPPFLALLIALLPWQQPDWLRSVLAEMAGALIPAAMFAVGLRLHISLPKQRGAFLAALAIKLAVMPMTAYVLAHVLGASRNVLQVAVLESAMPAMISAGAAAMSAGLAVDLVAALVGWGIFASLFTSPLWMLYLNR